MCVSAQWRVGADCTQFTMLGWVFFFLRSMQLFLFGWCLDSVYVFVGYSIDFDRLATNATVLAGEIWIRLHFMTLNQIEAGSKDVRVVETGNRPCTTKHSNLINMELLAWVASPPAIENHFSHFPISFVESVPNANEENEKNNLLASIDLLLAIYCQLSTLSELLVCIHFIVILNCEHIFGNYCNCE